MSITHLAPPVFPDKVKTSQEQHHQDSPLDSLRMSSLFYTQSSLKGTWGIEMPKIPNSTVFHLVLQGEAILNYAEEELTLEEGDFILLPHGEGHSICSHISVIPTALKDLPFVAHSPHFETLHLEGNGPETTLLCGAVLFTHEATAAILRTMPPYIRACKKHTPHYTSLHHTIQNLAYETRQTAFASHAIISRLADILVLQTVRIWIENLPTSEQNWIKAHSDKKLGPILHDIHANLDTELDLQGLAKKAGMSRSGFIQYFKETVGTPPMTYVTHWRLTCAKDRLLHNKEPITAIAFDAGYHSESAFSRAFKGHFGISPSQYRRQSLQKLS